MPFCGAFSFVVFALVHAGQYPAFVLVDAAAGQLGRRAYFGCFLVFFGLFHSVHADGFRRFVLIVFVRIKLAADTILLLP